MQNLEAFDQQQSSQPYADSLVSSYAQEVTLCGDPEKAYRALVPQDHRKRFGQFFTPPPIAKLMAEWIVEINPSSVLDPAVGPGVFPRLLSEMCPTAGLTCIDIDRIALDAARQSLASVDNCRFIEHDFLTWPDEGLFDAAIANPPYLRHHDVFYTFDIFYFVGKKNHVELSRLSNIYLLFILEICRRLRTGGRAAVIVPGEWVNANFGETLKRWLISRDLLHTLVYFSHLSTQFDDALTTASILFLERPQPDKQRDVIRTIFVNDSCEVDVIRRVVGGQASDDKNVVVQEFPAERLLGEKKWNHLLSHGHRNALPGFVRVSELAVTRRGIATGCNSFFHLSHSDAMKWGIRQTSLTPCVGRATDVPGLIFGKNDFERLVKNQGRTHLFDVQTEPNAAELAYIRKGEAEGLHRRFLCAARNTNWYAMEQRPPAAIWATVFARQGLRFVYNPEGIANLTTFHCIYPTHQSLAPALAACLNSRCVQDLGRRQQRVYGGGLLKVEPKDLLDVEVPDLRKVSNETLERLSTLLKVLDESNRNQTENAIIYAELDAAVENAAIQAAQSTEQQLL